MLDYSERKSLEAARNGWKYSIQVTRWFLTMIGGWPLALCETTMEKLTCIILPIICCFLTCFLLVPCTLRTILVDSDLNTKAQLMGLIIFLVMVLIKQYILITRNKNINEYIQNIREDWHRPTLSQEDLRIMLNNAKYGRQLSIITAIFLYVAGTFFTTIQPICMMRIQIMNNETARLLPFPTYQSLFNPKTTPFFEITYFVQTLAGYMTYTLHISVCSLIALFVTHICGQIQILILKMENFADGKERKNAKDTVEERLGDIVKSHVRIIR